MTTISQQVLEKLASIEVNIAEHFERDRTTCDKVNAMYKILVTGNGVKPLPEVVREHEKWIGDQEKEKDKREDTRLKINLMGLGQVFSLIGLAVAIWLGLK